MTTVQRRLPLFERFITLKYIFAVVLIHRPTAAQAMKHEWITMHLDTPKPEHRSSLMQSLIQGGGSERGTTFQKFLAMQKLKKAALVAIAAKLTQDEVGSLGDIFRLLDKEGNGVMTLTELDDAISGGKLTRSSTRLAFGNLWQRLTSSFSRSVSSSRRPISSRNSTKH
jgi:hypothetical protein